MNNVEAAAAAARTQLTHTRMKKSIVNSYE